MPTALSLFYDQEWLQKHHDRMPAGLAKELSRMGGWSESNIASKIWAAYLRNPEYLFRFNRAGNEGREKSKIPKEIIEYYDWIYAPLIEIKPKLEKNLKKILFRKKLNELYYWSSSDMHQGGVDNVMEMPFEFTYKILAIEKIDAHGEEAKIVAKMEAREVKLSATLARATAYGRSGMLRAADVERMRMRMKTIIDALFIPMEPKTQTGWEKYVFVNSGGYIPLFIYDFTDSNHGIFLNWVTNPFA